MQPYLDSPIYLRLLAWPSGDDCEGICKESPHDRDSHHLDADFFHGLELKGSSLGRWRLALGATFALTDLFMPKLCRV